MDSKQLGKIGEDLATDYLKRNGFKVLERNYIKEWDDKTKGEIDIIAKKDGVICFVEVKTSAAASGGGAFLPEDRVNFRKQKQLAKLSQKWLEEKRIKMDTPWQIDVVGVVLNEIDPKKSEIRHFSNAVSES